MNIDQSERGVETSRVIAAPRKKVFGAWTDPAKLARWWGPKGFTNRFQVCDIRPGGEWKFVMIAPNGQEFANESVFEEIVPGERIVILHLATVHRFRLTAEFADASGGTRVTWQQVFDTAEECDRVRKLVTAANEENLDRLEAVVRADD